MKKIGPNKIRRLAEKYREWLVAQTWFNSKINNTDEWLAPINKIIDQSANSPTLLWEAVVDHWQATNWDEDSFPTLFAQLYDMVDEYRTNRGVDGVDGVNLIIDALKKPESQSLSPQVIISQLYEKLTGELLVSETDHVNGEDYVLHEEVCEFFGLMSNRLLLNDVSVFCRNLTNQQLASELRTYQHKLFY
ncbi:GeBP family protein (plasmid) [Shewanella xiamenensis]|uniref:GeBP family protein n=1 Tax=Shewanella xiamenensis TaxID=332186 RepID=A0ABT6UDP3_9GAMM|nr:hypothetical protein [Shewanella xiamenensis]MDI5832567.1 GeBP family protein [Shewanella xiamenensis]WHF57814.1 GeBP family protein [Shewanella xiamenensis]